MSEGFGYGYPGYLILPENATKVIDEVRKQGLGPKMVGKQIIPFDYHRIVRGPDSKNGTTLNRSRSAVLDPVRVCG